MRGLEFPLLPLLTWAIDKFSIVIQDRLAPVHSGFHVFFFSFESYRHHIVSKTYTQLQQVKLSNETLCFDNEQR